MQNFQFHAFLQEVDPHIISFHHSLGEEKLSSGEVKHLLKSSWSLAGVGGECHLLGLSLLCGMQVVGQCLAFREKGKKERVMS